LGGYIDSVLEDQRLPDSYWMVYNGWEGEARLVKP